VGLPQVGFFMPEETLITAARRAIRFIRIDEAKGGFIRTETTQAVDTLDKQLRIALAQEERKAGKPETDQGEM
jgi:hypothetical protein